MSTARPSLVLGTVREQGTIGLTAALAGVYSGFMLTGSSTLAASAGAQRGAIGVVLDIVATVFIAIALYASAVVIAGSVATVISGRATQIATLRLLGADAPTLRTSIVRGVAMTALLGGAFGAVIGVLGAVGGRVALVSDGTLPRADYPWFNMLVIPAIIVIAATAGAAGFVGSAKVLTLSPAAALSGVHAPATARSSRVRAVLAVATGLVGVALLGLACQLGEEGSSAGMLTGFFGGATAYFGFIMGAPFIVPRLVEAFGRVLGAGPGARIARRNAVADRMRTTRATLGLIIGVALVTTFASGSAALSDAVHSWDMPPRQRERALDALHMSSMIMMGLVVIASIIAAVGLVATMSLSVLQRRREIGMLRAIGFTAKNVQAMVTRESLALGLSAVILGVLIGVALGSIGAQSLMGKVTHGFVLGVPGGVLAVIAVAAVLLVLVAALPPARRATRLSPVEALHHA